MLFGLGWAEWLLLAGLAAGVVFTFKVMARASVAYARAREMREAEERGSSGRPASADEVPGKE